MSMTIEGFLPFWCRFDGVQSDPALNCPGFRATFFLVNGFDYAQEVPSRGS